MRLQHKVALVTGAGGFLGSAIARALRAQGHEVRGFSRGKYPQLREFGVEFRQGDLANRGDVQEAAAGCDIVYHVAARAGSWGSYESFYEGVFGDEPPPTPTQATRSSYAVSGTQLGSSDSNVSMSRPAASNSGAQSAGADCSLSR